MSFRILRPLANVPLAAALLMAVGCGGAPGTPVAARTRQPAPVAQRSTSVPASSAPSPAATAQRRRPLAGKVIVLDPGHNGANWANPQIINRPVNVITESKPCDTTGTQTDAGYTEHAFNFSVATMLARLLRAEGATVVLTRTSDTGVGPCITQRAAIGNRAHAAAAISIHADGGPPSGYGFDVIEPGLVPGHTDAIVGPSARLGLAIRDAYHRFTGEPYATYVGHNAIDVRTDLGGLNLSEVPKVFIECGNMRNAQDAARLSSITFQRRIAEGLAAGFLGFLTSGGQTSG